MGRVCRSCGVCVGLVGCVCGSCVCGNDVP